MIVNVRILPMPDNAQPKPWQQAAASGSQYAHMAVPDSPFRAAIRPVSAANTACFRMQDRTFCNPLRDRLLARAHLAGDCDMKVQVAARAHSRA